MAAHRGIANHSQAYNFSSSFQPSPPASYYSMEVPIQDRKVFVGGLTHDTEDKELKEYYSQWGRVVDCIVLRDPLTNNSRGFGFVTYETLEMVERALNSKPHTIRGKVVDPKRAVPREQIEASVMQDAFFLNDEIDPVCKVALTGIHWDFHTVDGIRHYFERFGVVEQVEVKSNPKGTGFVIFERREDVIRCRNHGAVHIINSKQDHLIEACVVAAKQNVQPPPGFGLFLSPQDSGISTPKSSASEEEYPPLSYLP